MDIQGNTVHLQVPLGKDMFSEIWKSHLQRALARADTDGKYVSLINLADMPIQCNQILAEETTYYRRDKSTAETTCG